MFGPLSVNTALLYIVADKVCVLLALVTYNLLIHSMSSDFYICFPVKYVKKENKQKKKKRFAIQAYLSKQY